MAAETLESRLEIRDGASGALEEIEERAGTAADALAEVLGNLEEIGALGDVDIRGAGTEEAQRRIRQALDRIRAERWESEIDAAIDGLGGNGGEDAGPGDAGPEGDGGWEAAIDEALGAFDGLPNALELLERELESLRDMDRLEAELAELRDIGGDGAQEIAERTREIMERDEEAWQEVLADVEAQSERVMQEWGNAEQGIVDITDSVQEQARETGQEVTDGIRGLGADIAGWWAVAKDAFGKIRDTFETMAEEADKLNTRMARFGLVADAEGKTGAARGERSAELYKEHQKFAQALGVQSEAFNETVLNMYSNGQGVVKSIEEAQTIAASSYMAMDIAGLRGSDKDAVMGEIQSMVSVGIADPDQIQEAMKIAPNILRSIERQWERNQGGKPLKIGKEEVESATGKIAALAQEGEITAELVAQAMVNSAKETKETWEELPSTWEKLQNRAKIICENMAMEITQQIGKLADSPLVADFVMNALRLGERLVSFAKDYVLPVIGNVAGAIAAALSAVMGTLADMFGSMETGIPTAIALGAAVIGIAAKAGILTTAIGAVRAAIIAITANPFVLVATAVLAAVVAMAYFVKTTQEGQEIMLQVTAAITMAAKQVGALFMGLPGIAKWAISRIVMFWENWILGMVTDINWLLDKFGVTSETAKELEAGMVGIMRRTQAWGDEGVDEMAAEFSANYTDYENYTAMIPEYAKENLEKGKDELKLTGFLDEIISKLTEIPGTKDNPANVKGKVAIDGEYMDIIKRAAGVEIVNRYTTLRPTVNAKFGDIHQVDTKDILGELGRSIQDAEGAAISDAQALGA